MSEAAALPTAPQPLTQFFHSVASFKSAAAAAAAAPAAAATEGTEFRLRPG